ncbi:MAG: hypothetical protein WBG92_02350, partial [Thiohalocapsa sp.]
SVQSLPVSALETAVSELIGQDIGDQVPVYLQAWGGHGGQGGGVQDPRNLCCTAAPGNGGQQGNARTSMTFGNLSADFPTLSLYVGANGVHGTDLENDNPSGNCLATGAGQPGGGGAATLVLSQPLSAETEFAGVLLIAGGGGGGGQGLCSGNISLKGLKAEPGPVAIATTSGAVSAADPDKSSGGDGNGGCRTGVTCGADGIGGLGGGSVDNPMTGWIGTSSTWSQGQGGHSSGFVNEQTVAEGGAGGGGFGGGGVGKFTLNTQLRGGGSGGSYAAQATLNDSGAPVASNPTSDSGSVVISLDVCLTYPSIAACQSSSVSNADRR